MKHEDIPNLKEKNWMIDNNKLYCSDIGCLRDFLALEARKDKRLLEFVGKTIQEKEVDCLYVYETTIKSTVTGKTIDAIFLVPKTTQFFEREYGLGSMNESEAVDFLKKNISAPVVIINRSGIPFINTGGVPMFEYILSALIAAGNPQACMTVNIWHEARGESMAGMALVAQNVMARVGSRYYPDSVCDVVFQKMPGGSQAYSWVGKTKTIPEIKNRIDQKAFERAVIVAKAFLAEDNPVRFAGLENGVLYHEKSICPAFCKSKYTRRIAQVGSHVIYEESRGKKLRP